MAAIKKSDGSLHCGGSLTSRNTAVSAAHCFIDISTGKKLSLAKIQAFRVVLGSSNPFDFKGKLRKPRTSKLLGLSEQFKNFNS